MGGLELKSEKKQNEILKKSIQRGLLINMLITVCIAVVGTIIGKLIYLSISGEEYRNFLLFNDILLSIVGAIIISVIIWLITKKRYHKSKNDGQ